MNKKLSWGFSGGDDDFVSGVEDVRGSSVAREAAARCQAQHGLGCCASDWRRGGQVLWWWILIMRLKIFFKGFLLPWQFWPNSHHATMLISDHSQGLEADLARPLEGGRSWSKHPWGVKCRRQSRPRKRWGAIIMIINIWIKKISFNSITTIISLGGWIWPRRRWIGQQHKWELWQWGRRGRGWGRRRRRGGGGWWCSRLLQQRHWGPSSKLTFPILRVSVDA